MDGRQPRLQARARVQATPAGPAPAVQAVPVAPFMGGMPTVRAPVRLPEGGLGASVMRGRSVFDETVRGPGARVQLVPVHAGPFPVLGGEQISARNGPVPVRPFAVARADLGQTPAPPPAERSAVEKVIQRELPSAGLTGQEAAAISGALGPAIEASVKAVTEGVACGKVNSFMIQEVRVLKDTLDRFAASARPDERTNRLVADDFSKIDEVLACQTVYEQVSDARKQKITALLLGGVIVGAVVLVAVS